MEPKKKFNLIDADGISRTLARLAMEIIERNKGAENLLMVGVRTRGVPLAERLSKIIAEFNNGKKIPVGILDITLYRDDFKTSRNTPEVKATDIRFDINNQRVILVDDVLYTGRTARAAIEAILDYGRPSRLQLAVLIDRGHREMPIQADFVGKHVHTSPYEEVLVQVKETDGADKVVVVEHNNDTNGDKQ